MRIFLSGGCKNGKSTLAQHMAMAQGENVRYYIATMRPTDKEDRDRVFAHQLERKEWGFDTIECPENLLEHMNELDAKGSFLLDSITALLANEMFTQSGEINYKAHEKIIDEFNVLLNNIENIVIVSDYIYGDYMGDLDEISFAYCKSLAQIDKAIAKLCDKVIEVNFGNMTHHKGAQL